MFRRKNSDPFRTIEAELAKLRQRRDALVGQLQTAEGEAETAIAHRRTLLVDGDDASPADLQRAEVACASTASRQNALADAVAQLGRQIAEREAQLAADRTRVEREKAAADLEQRARELAALGDQLVDAAAGLGRLYGEFRAAADAKGIAVRVFPGYDRPPATAALAVLIASFEQHLPVQALVRNADAPAPHAASDVLSEQLLRPMQGLAAAIRAGEVEPAKASPASVPAASAPIRIAEMEVALLENVEWVDAFGGVGRALAGGASLSAPIAEEALRVGAAVPADSAEGQAVIQEAQAPDVAPGARNLRPTRIQRGPPWRFLDVSLRGWAERGCLATSAAA